MKINFQPIFKAHVLLCNKILKLMIAETGTKCLPSSKVIITVMIIRANCKLMLGFVCATPDITQLIASKYLREIPTLFYAKFAVKSNTVLVYQEVSLNLEISIILALK